MDSDEPTGVVDPGPARPDTADWTWVLLRPCPDCGFRATDIRPEGVTEIVRDCARRYVDVLRRPDARLRPEEGVWSPLEYACHVRDLCDVMRERLELVLAGGGDVVTFENWDQDATAGDKAYWRSDPERVARELAVAFEAAAEAYDRPTPAQWQWRGVRGNGSVFTLETLGQYFVHDLLHHLWDVRG